MDVETTDKQTMDGTLSSNGKDGVSRSKATSSSAIARTLKLSGVELKIVGETLGILKDYKESFDLVCVAEGDACRITFRKGEEKVFEVLVKSASQVYQAGSLLLFLRISQGSAVIATRSQNDISQLLNYLHTYVAGGQKKLSRQSVFSLRTEEGSAKQYFQFYGFLSQQQNMMQDYIRTATYQCAMLQNPGDFQDKVVLDVGAGTGILSFFAVQSGARKVYCVEASSVSVHCQRLIKDNKLGDKITVIAGKIEEVDLPEKVDVIISEPMGYMLYNERMLESFLHAKKWLKPGGKMYPTQGVLYVAPFTDEQLFMEQSTKAFFWTQNSFYGIDLSGLKAAALEEYFKQPILDAFDVRILMCKPVGHTTDFMKAQETDLHKVTIPFKFAPWYAGIVHGLAFWFDVAFCGSQVTIWLSTAPFQPLTHWYQIRCLFSRPIFVRAGQELSGTVQLTANERQSYDVDIDVTLVGEGVKFTGSYDLKNPNFRYMTMPPPPPGSQNANPTEAYFEPNTSSSNNNPYAHASGGTLHQATALIPHSPQIMSPTSAGGTVVVSAMTPHPVMAVHAAPPGINGGVPLMNGGVLGGPMGHTHSSSKSSGSSGSGGTLHGIHTQPPLLQSPPPGHAHLPSVSPHGHGAGGPAGGGLLQAVGGAAHHQTQYVYASAATAVGTMASPHFVYRFHQMNPSTGRPYSTY